MSEKDKILNVKEETLLMPFLIHNLKDKNRDNIKSLLKNKQVWINGKSISQFNHPLHSGDIIEIKWARSSDIPSENYFTIIYEDNDIIVIDKKAGLLSVSDGNAHITARDLLDQWVQKKNPGSKVFVVHRLDQYTSGLLMFVKNEKVQNIFRNNWKTFIKERVYSAVVEGKVLKKSGRISSYLMENAALKMISVNDSSQGKMAITNFKTIKTTDKYSLLEVCLDTGRKNQIRVHMQDIGHSIAGDRKYGAKSNPIGRLCLHATILALTHPVSGELLRFESKIPREFDNLFRNFLK